MAKEINQSKLFFAFAAGKESVESTNQIKRFIGVAPVYVLAVNPTKKELEDIYGTTIEKEIEYVSQTDSRFDEGLKVDQVRIDFVVKTDPEKCDGIDMKTKVTFFLNKEYRYNKDKTKVQVINKYGETTWLTIEDAKNKVVPSNLSWFEPADFRPALVGEEELTHFIKTYLGVPNKSYRKNDGTIVEIENKSDAEARLDCFADYFKGNFKELKDIINLQPNNRVKCLFGVRNVENKMYQAVYTQKFLKLNASNYDVLAKDLADKKAAGSYPTTEFEICNLKEYVVNATNFAETKTEVNNPFGGDTESPWGMQSPF